MLPVFLISIVGPDQPGLVEKIALAVAEHEGNWLESRMAHLGGHFAGMVRISVPEGQSGELLAALQALNVADFVVTVRPEAPASDVSSQRKNSRLLTLDLVGADRPGIVRVVSKTLAAHGCNVEEFSSGVTSAPMSGEPLFHAKITVYFPEGASVAQVREDLEEIADDLMVEIETTSG